MEATIMSEWKDKYFEEKFKNVDSSINRVLEKVSENTDLTKDIQKEGRANADRIMAIEAEVFQKPQVKNLPPFYRDPKVVQIILLIVFIVAGIIAMLLGIDLKGVL